MLSLYVCNKFIGFWDILTGSPILTASEPTRMSPYWPIKRIGDILIGSLTLTLIDLTGNGNVPSSSLFKDCHSCLISAKHPTQNQEFIHIESIDPKLFL